MSERNSEDTRETSDARRHLQWARSTTHQAPDDLQKIRCAAGPLCPSFPCSSGSRVIIRPAGERVEPGAARVTNKGDTREMVSARVLIRLDGGLAWSPSQIGQGELLREDPGGEGGRRGESTRVRATRVNVLTKVLAGSKNQQVSQRDAL